MDAGELVARWGNSITSYISQCTAKSVRSVTRALPMEGLSTDDFSYSRIASKEWSLATVEVFCVDIDACRSFHEVEFKLEMVYFPIFPHPTRAFYNINKRTNSTLVVILFFRIDDFLHFDRQYLRDGFRSCPWKDNLLAGLHCTALKAITTLISSSDTSISSPDQLALFPVSFLATAPRVSARFQWNGFLPITSSDRDASPESLEVWHQKPLLG